MYTLDLARAVLLDLHRDAARHARDSGRVETGRGPRRLRRLTRNRIGG